MDVKSTQYKICMLRMTDVRKCVFLFGVVFNSSAIKVFACEAFCQLCVEGNSLPLCSTWYMATHYFLCVSVTQN